MGTLDSELGSGETQPLDRPWYNDLVNTLKDLMHAGGIRVEASTNRVVVHHADDSLVPGDVALNDVTGWGKPAAGRISLDWTITSGPGSLNTTTTAAGAAVVWTWSGAAWDATVDGNKLPAEVTVQVQATDDQEGTTLSSTDVSFIVGRSYDPAAHPGVTPHVEPTRDVAYLSGDGTTTIEFDDYTDFGDQTSVTRTVTAELRGGDGSNASVSGSYTDGSQNIVGASDLAVDATAQAPGVLVVTAEYEDGNNNLTTTKRAVRVRPSLDLGEEATADPTLPAVSLTKDSGGAILSVGMPVSPSNVEEAGPVFEAGGPIWAEGRAEALARRLGVQQLEKDDPQLSLLQQAGSLLVSALAHPTEAGLMEYTLGSLPDAATPGDVLIFDGGELRLEEQSGGGWTAIGFLEEGADTSSAHLTGNGAMFTVEAEIAYGQAGNSDFPTETHTRYKHIRPDESEATIRLPYAQPEAAGDRWHIRYRVQSEWTGGASVTGNWSTWAEAEAVPDGPASAELQSDGMLSITAPGTAQGRVGWEAAGNNPIDDADVFGADLLPNAMPAPPPNHYWDGPNNPPHLYAKLLQTAPSGSSRDQIERFDLTYTPEASAAVPHAPVSGNAIPDDWNVVTGMMLTGDTRSWIGSPNGWVSLGTGGQMVDTVELVYDGTAHEATKNGSTEFVHGVPFFSIGELTVRLYTAGPVDEANLFDGDHTLFRQRDTTPVFNENGGYWEQVLDVPPTANGLQDRLLYQVSAGSDEQLVRLTLENANIDQTDAPDVLTLDALVQNNPSIAKTIDRSATPNEWTLTLEDDEEWEGAYLTLTAESLEDAQIQSATIQDGNSTSINLDNIPFSVQTDTTPQRAYLELNDSAFSGPDDIVITLQLTGNGTNTTVDLKVVPFS